MEVRPVAVLAVRVVAHADQRQVVNVFIAVDMQSSLKYSELFVVSLMGILSMRM